MASEALLRKPARHRYGFGAPRPLDMLFIFGLLGATSALCVIFAQDLGETRLTLVYLAPVVIAAVSLGLWSGLIAALGAVGLLNFLFALPQYSLVVANGQDLVTLVIFFALAATTGGLAGRLREERDGARANAHALEILSAASGLLQEAQSREAVFTLTTKALADLTRRAVLIMARQGQGELTLLEQSAGALTPQLADFHAADKALSRGQVEPAAAAGWNGASYSFLPIELGEGAGEALALGLLRPPAGERPDPYQAAATEVLCQQCALALQRLHLGSRVLAEQEKAAMENLRAALLSSLSHDLRSPLAGILGSVTTLNELGDHLAPEAQRDLLAGIEAETRRLAAYVEYLLHLTRLQAGTPPEFEPISLTDALQAAENRLRQNWPQAQIRHELGPLRPIRADSALLEQAIYNLLDNAMRHGGGKIALRSWQGGAKQHLTIADEGPEVPLGESARAQGREGRVAGLGLPISRAIATALGGELRSESVAKGRAMTLAFPAADLAQSEGAL